MRDLRVRLESSLHPLDDADSGSGSGDLRGDFDLNPDYRSSLDGRAMKPAAVLVPLVERRDGTSVLLTQRTEHLNDHAGQISFPGGSIESVDADAVAAALRETDEEIGIQPDLVEILGFLDTYETGTGFRITPVVGFVDSGYTLELDDFEVAEVFEVPLAFVFDPANHERRSQIWQGQRQQFYVINYQKRFIWGATAGMLVNLYGKLHGKVAAP
ncbi:MAG: CoA pyrophosphatase [Alphaproteobacteria bacterium]|jgi:8-oxo-dGTP pyrophosphatase MutT (NUDIX family)|nr:CoA pyrophosphatase [Alphaproteobacteria bacterium]|tara:strand:- start:236 stop:877 length:642 start_codon:yes stop_codon:yes gene_type:complete